MTQTIEGTLSVFPYKFKILVYYDGCIDFKTGNDDKTVELDIKQYDDQCSDRAINQVERSPVINAVLKNQGYDDRN